jgi:hypothetical protein
MNLPATRSSASRALIPRWTNQALLEVRGEVAVQAAKIQAVTCLVHQAQEAVADISEEEGRLIARTPLAEHRLRFITDQGAAQIASVLRNSGF